MGRSMIFHMNGALGVSEVGAERIDKADPAEDRYRESHLINAGAWVSFLGIKSH